MDLKTLIEDYKRREKSVMKLIADGGNDLTLNRLGTKASCYREFIHELNKLKQQIMKPKTKYWIVYFILIVFIILSFSCSEQYDDEYYLDCEKYNEWVERSYKERLSRCNKCKQK